MLAVPSEVTLFFSYSDWEKFSSASVCVCNCFNARCAHHVSIEWLDDTTIFPLILWLSSACLTWSYYTFDVGKREWLPTNISHIYLNTACTCGLKDGSWYLPTLRQVSLVIESDKYKTAQVEEKLLTERRLLPSDTYSTRMEVDPLCLLECAQPLSFSSCLFIISNSPFLSRKCSRLFAHAQARERAAALSRGSQKQLHPSCASVDSADCQEGGVNSVPHCVLCGPQLTLVRQCPNNWQSCSWEGWESHHSVKDGADWLPCRSKGSCGYTCGPLPPVWMLHWWMTVTTSTLGVM